MPAALEAYKFKPGHTVRGGRPQGRLATRNMIHQLVIQHPEYRTSIRRLLQEVGASPRAAEVLMRNLDRPDARAQLRSVELIARITGELKEATIIQQQAVSVEDTTKLRALAEQLLAARQPKPVATLLIQPTAGVAANPLPCPDAASSMAMVNQQVDLMNQHGNSVDQSTENQ